MGLAKTELQLELPLAGAAHVAPGGQFSLPLERNDAAIEAGPVPPQPPRPSLPFRLRRSPRGTIGFAVDELGLKVYAPRGLAVPQIEQVMRERGQAIYQKLADRPMLNAHTPPRWQDGARFVYLGQSLQVRLADDVNEALTRGGCLCLPLPPEAQEAQIRDRAHAWLQAEARRVLTERIALWAHRLGIDAPVWQLSFGGRNWGSVDEGGRLKLSWRLIHLPLRQLDGVVTRQLARMARRTTGELWSNAELPA